MTSHLFRPALALFCGSLFFLSTQAQDLPAGFAPGEQAKMGQYLQNVKDQPRGGITTPPVSPVRTAAEWEEIQALTITWTSYQSILKEIVRYAREETQVYIVCSDSNTVKNYLTSNNVLLSNIHYVIAPYNSIWIRDYGQNTVYTNDVDSLILVDWIYNRPRPKDDTIPSVLASRLNIPLYETKVAPNNLIHTGGNFMSDGFGTAFSSELVLDENPTKTNAQIDSIMYKFMGINRYIKMDVLPYDGIHHIDMHMKLLDEQTLLVGQYPTGVADGPQIEANLQYVLSNYNSVFGTPYKVIRIPMPPETNGLYPPSGDYNTYTNAVFINKTVILPLYYQQYDTTALRIWREALPGYRIIGINCNSIIQASGAIHCITHSIGTSDPLLISHQPHGNTTNTTTPYQVDATLMHRSGISSATLYYTTDTTQPYIAVPMTANVPGNTWTGFIPAQPVGTHVFYYVHGQSVSGKTQVRPLPAPTAYWKFEVTGSASVVNEEPTFGIRPVYPNPSKGITCIPVSVPSAAKGKIAMHDMLGKEVAVIHDGEMPAGEKNYFINTVNVTPGAYMILVRTPEGIRTHKLMVR
jgi:agmatine deiminase